MAKLGWPAPLFCNEPIIGEVFEQGFKMRCEKSKARQTVRALQSCGFETIAAGLAG